MIDERFATKFITEPNTSCWLWTAATNAEGYGRFKVDGKTRRAHRIAWELHNGPIPEGVQVLHECDTPPCVNPAHLFLGTIRDNQVDSARKGRRPRGPVPGGTVLTADQVQEIRTSGASARILGRRFGVTEGAIRHVRCRRTWAWLQEAIA